MLTLRSSWVGLVLLAMIGGGAPMLAEGAAVALDPMPPTLEVKFALSALPQSLPRSRATVYVLDPTTGYRVYTKGTNGQSCLVERTEWRREDFRNDIYTALCYDEAGAEAQLQVWMDFAQLRAAGMSPSDLKKEIERRFAAGIYAAPKRPGFSYMTAPLMRTYPNPDFSDKTVVTMSMPHIMYYAPNLTDADIGGVPPQSPYPFIFEQGPQGYMIQLIGETERKQIVADNAGLLSELCAYRSYLCFEFGLGDKPGGLTKSE